jgi:hypothetical protein
MKIFQKTIMLPRGEKRVSSYYPGNREGNRY